MSCETFNQEMRAGVPENQKWLFDFYDPAQMLEPEIGVIGAGVYRAALAYMYEETGNIMSKPFALLDGCMSLCRAWGRYFGGIRAYE